MKLFTKIANGLSAVAFALYATAALAQAPVEVPFFFPVAVGGPITKIIDGYAADFEKDNPGIKLRPIYAGSYQDTIAKALTAVKSGEPPVTETTKVQLAALPAPSAVEQVAVVSPIGNEAPEAGTQVGVSISRQLSVSSEPRPNPCQASPTSTAYSASRWSASATRRPTPSSFRSPSSSSSATIAISRS